MQPSSRPTEIKLKNEGDVPFTRMEVTTRDRPGLLVDIVRTLKDCNIQVRVCACYHRRHAVWLHRTGPPSCFSKF